MAKPKAIIMTSPAKLENWNPPPRSAELSAGFGAKPDDHDGGEGKEHPLAEEGELADVLGEQLCDEAR